MGPYIFSRNQLYFGLFMDLKIAIFGPPYKFFFPPPLLGLDLDVGMQLGCGLIVNKNLGCSTNN